MANLTDDETPLPVLLRPSCSLQHWLDLLEGLDVRNLQSEWAQITSSALCSELAWMIASADEHLLSFDSLWDIFQQDRMRKLFAQFYKPTLEDRRKYTPDQLTKNRISGEDLYQRVRAMIAGALAVSAANGTQPALLHHWLDTSIRLWNGSEPSEKLTTLPKASPFQSANPWERMEAALELWKAENAAELPLQIGAARTWIQSLFNALRTYDLPLEPFFAEAETSYRVTAHCETWLLSYRTDGSATLGRIHYEAIEGGKGEHYPHPKIIGLLPLSDEFQQTIKNAWEVASRQIPQSEALAAKLADHDFRWWVEGYAAPSEGDAALRGASHGAAAAVTIAQLLLNEPIDPEFAVTGEIDAHGTLHKVGYVKEKASGALQRFDGLKMPVITRFCVPHANRTDAEEGAMLVGRPPAQCIQPVADLRELLFYASGLPQQIRRLCEKERDTVLMQAAQRLQRPLSRSEDYQKIYVPMDVEISRALPTEGERAGLRHTSEHHWSDIRDGLQRALIIAESGQGKTALLWQEIAERCSRGCELLNQRNRSVHEIPFAVFFPAKSLPQIRPDSQSMLETFASHLLSRISVRETLYPHVHRVLCGMIEAGHCTLFIDALDEASAQTQSELQSAVPEFVHQYPHVRMVITMRPSALSENWQSQNDWDRITLLPFRNEQIKQAIDLWLQEDPVQARTFWNYLDTHRRHLKILQSPLLLWIACNIAPATRQSNTHPISWRRRSDLFDMFVDVSLNKWMQRRPVPTPAQKNSFRSLLGDIAFQLLQKREKGDFWDANRVDAAIAVCAENTPALAQRDIRKDLLTSGMFTLMPTSNKEADWAFSHVAVGNYLAGCSIAKRANTSRWNEIEKILDRVASDPAWHEAIVFASVDLNNPVPLLEMLTDAERDDEIRTRLALAAQCLAEISLTA